MVTRSSLRFQVILPFNGILLCKWKFYLQTGLASLFNAIKLYDTSYHSLGVHFRPVCQVSDWWQRVTKSGVWPCYFGKNGNSLHTLRRPYYFNYREKVHRTTSKVSSLTWINISCIASLLGWRWRIYHGKILPCPKLRLRAVITKIVVVLVKWWKNVSFLYRMRVAPWRHWSWASRWQWYLNRQ